MTTKSETALTIPPVHYTMNEDSTLLIKSSELLANVNVDSGKKLDILSIINPQGTLINNNNATWSFTPSKFFSGSLILDCIISDGVNKAVQPIKIDVLHISHVLSNPEIEFEMQEDGTCLINTRQLLDNATDIEGDNLDIISMVAAQGIFVNNHNGTWKFRPNAEYMGTIDLTFIVSDGHAQVAQNLLVTMNTPIFMPEIDVLMNENEAFTFTTDELLQNSDVDGDLLSIIDLRDPMEGQLINNDNGTWTYLPPENYIGPLQLQFGIADERGTVIDQAINLYAVSEHVERIQQKILHIEENAGIIIDKADLIPPELISKSNILSISNLTTTQGKIRQYGTQHEMKWLFIPNANFTDVIDLQYTIDDGRTQTSHFISIEVEDN